MMRRGTLVTLASMGTLAVVYLKLIRPRTMRWGATDEEVDRSLPGDSIVGKADFNATRAITIAAPPKDVWPWLLQMGSGRAGWYTYDWIDNARVPSADAIVPELQGLAVGDLVPMVSGKDIGVWVKDLQPECRMLWWDRKGEYSWEWVLDPVGEQSTRLITRLRATFPPLLSPKMLYAVVASTGDIVMIRKALRGIKTRAERLRSTSEAEVRS
jgi:hypothetical protein